MRHIALLCLLAVFVVSCTKDVVGPCGTVGNESEFNGKNRPNGSPIHGTDGPGIGTAQGGEGAADPAGGAEPGPSGISDDGDDISDSEKSRRKRR